MTPNHRVEILLPSQLELGTHPPLASITFLDLALRLVKDSIAIEHHDLDEVDTLRGRYSPDHVLILATHLVEQAAALQIAIARYQAALRHETNPKPEFPF
jgi:hypothetical protein